MEWANGIAGHAVPPRVNRAAHIKAAGRTVPLMSKPGRSPSLLMASVLLHPSTFLSRVVIVDASAALRG
ncbi:hypothetical protein WJ59_18305 [Burkholderia gladioli]|uniref:hypothetical protein n=1 Tax=Burkholderia gladioli TaxID=28095 RepID=UPI00050EC69B|nr:hypothetical protein [Burkholderia gladioli]KGE09294.1 hypothetical protein LA03_16560 [Burkholderia gladioli]KVM65574.1 hypothetical protein WJ59_18305 [Burkholderia gladioli]